MIMCKNEILSALRSGRITEREFDKLCMLNHYHPCEVLWGKR